MTTSRFVDNGDVRLHYLDSGGDDPRAPIVFVPGMTCVAEDYLEALPHFGRRTIVVELRGHGKSAAPADGYDVAALAGDIDAVVNDVTAGPVHIVTFSRGTTYAAAWAVAQPDRVRSVSIGDYILEERVLTDAEERMLLDGRWRGTPVRERLDTRAATATFRAARSRFFWEPLAQLRCPLLVVRAGNSPIVEDQDWARYSALFPGAELHVFDHSPHDIFRPDRSRYPLLVRNHVDRVDPSFDHSVANADGC